MIPTDPFGMNFSILNLLHFLRRLQNLKVLEKMNFAKYQKNLVSGERSNTQLSQSAVQHAGGQVQAKPPCKNEMADREKAEQIDEARK